MVNFARITSQSDLYNFHSHTLYCDGHASMRAFVEAAIEAGFTDYGFSPHSPIPFDSPCNAKRQDMEKYLAEFLSLKQEFCNRINLYHSLEIDYIDENWGPANPYFSTLNLDYRIGSIHFIPHNGEFIDTDGRFSSFQEKMAQYFDGDIHYVVERFYDQTLKMIEKGGFDIIGHFDKIGQNASYFQPGIEQAAWYRKLIENVIHAIKDCGLIVEINTKSLAEHHRFFPNERYFPLLKRYEIPVVVNSDAHYPALINSGRMEALHLLKTR